MVPTRTRVPVPAGVATRARRSPPPVPLSEAAITRRAVALSTTATCPSLRGSVSGGCGQSCRSLSTFGRGFYRITRCSRSESRPQVNMIDLEAGLARNTRGGQNQTRLERGTQGRAVRCARAGMGSEVASRNAKSVSPLADSPLQHWCKSVPATWVLRATTARFVKVSATCKNVSRLLSSSTGKRL